MEIVEPQVSNGYAPPVRRDKRRRFQFRFHLDVTKDQQLELGRELEDLKRRRKYTSTILDALYLVLDLRKGSTKVLRAMFPSIVQSIEKEAVERLEVPANNQVMLLMAQIVDIQKQLAQRPITPTLPVPQPVTVGHTLPGPKMLNIPKVDTPTFDDDDDLPAIAIKKDTSTNSSGNFLKSLSALAGNAFVDAPPDDGKEARKNFTSGMGDLFGSDDDEWDD